MSVLRILAASDMAASEAHAQLVPCRPERKAFFAALRARLDIVDRTEVFARDSHIRVHRLRQSRITIAQVRRDWSTRNRAV
jgi:hypothetical protein